MYRPLPDNVTVGQSNIEGLGLFAIRDITEGTTLGATHIVVNIQNDRSLIHRTPLGGFGNHSDEPNCNKVESNMYWHKCWNIVTNRDIKKGEEITWKYTLYSVN